MKVAVIGSGIAGLAAAHAMRGKAAVTLFEADSRFGGHANTVDLALDGVTHGVDTGFLVLNERTYPGLLALFGELGVELAGSDMSFSVQVPGAFGSGALEWSGNDLGSVFCQRSNALRPRFWRMLRDLLRFNAIAMRLARAPSAALTQSLGSFLHENDFSNEFRDWYLLPMIGCIWSSPPRTMLRYPIGALVRFCDNHGLLQIAGRPQWYTVAGGSRRYVDAIVARIPDARLNTPVHHLVREGGRVQVVTERGGEWFDAAVVATHADQALDLLPDASLDEQSVLGAIRFQRNRAVLHTDASVLPTNRRAWAAWNYESRAGASESHVCLHYLINRLQPLPWTRPVIVSLNPLRPIDPAQVVAEFDYAHPVFDAAALQAQARLPRLQGRRGVWFCGAWTGNGFHEAGLASGQTAANALVVHQRIRAVEAALA
jgi:uncharacterized protein